MARQSSVDLNPFVRWLVAEDFKQERTAHVYASNTRRVLESLEHLDQDSLTSFFRKLHEKGTKKYYAYKTAWKKFGEWAEAERGMKLPMPQSTTVLRTSDLPALPEAVRSSLTKLMNKATREKPGLNLSIEVVSDLRWKNLHPDFPSVSYRDASHPNDPHRRIRIPKSWLVPLKEYAQPDGNGEVALIPISPKSETPYPIKALKREYLSHKRFLSRS